MPHLLDTESLVQKSQLQPGMHVADFGCGRTGHIVFPAALAVGESGIVFAVDILKDVLESVKKRASAQSLLNVHTVWSDVDVVGKTAIPEKSLDVIFLVNTLSHGQKTWAPLEEADRLLRHKGRIVVVDWKIVVPSLSPKEEYLVDFEAIKEWALQKGYVVQEEFAPGNYHVGMILFRQI